MSHKREVGAEQTTISSAETTSRTRATEEETAQQDLIEDELLIEEIHIDGVCGVY